MKSSNPGHKVHFARSLSVTALFSLPLFLVPFVVIILIKLPWPTLMMRINKQGRAPSHVDYPNNRTVHRPPKRKERKNQNDDVNRKVQTQFQPHGAPTMTTSAVSTCSLHSLALSTAESLFSLWLRVCLHFCNIPGARFLISRLPTSQFTSLDH